jgi:hypothetical protein
MATAIFLLLADFVFYSLIPIEYEAATNFKRVRGTPHEGGALPHSTPPIIRRIFI